MVLLGLIILDLSTIGKHIAFLKANIKNDQELIKKQAEERRKEALKVAEAQRKKQKRKPKTVINTKAYLKKLAERRAANSGTHIEETEKFSVVDESEIISKVVAAAPKQPESEQLAEEKQKMKTNEPEFIELTPLDPVTGIKTAKEEGEQATREKRKQGENNSVTKSEGELERRKKDGQEKQQQGPPKKQPDEMSSEIITEGAGKNSAALKSAGSR